MHRLAAHVVVLSTLILTACPDSDGPLQTSATEASASSTSTAAPGETVSSSGNEQDGDASTGTAAGSTTTDATTTAGEETCGDGKLDPEEDCDDGEENNTEGPCTLECTLACGDGELQTGEECDLGPMNNNTGACTKECKNARCGDEFIQPGETCDDGDKNSDAPGACSPATCTPNILTCGNGTLDEGEVCDKSAPGMEAVDCTGSCTFVSRTVFVTADTYIADFSGMNLGDLDLVGLESADQLCRTLAQEANLDLGETFIALLSTPAQPIGQRLGNFGGEYTNTAATQIAVGKQALLSGTLKSPIALDQFGQSAMNENTFAWTGSLISGEASSATCSAWNSTSSQALGLVGKLGETTALWLNNKEVPCNSQAHFYCIQNGD